MQQILELNQCHRGLLTVVLGQFEALEQCNLITAHYYGAIMKSRLLERAFQSLDWYSFWLARQKPVKRFSSSC